MSFVSIMLYNSGKYEQIIESVKDLQVNLLYLRTLYNK